MCDERIFYFSTGVMMIIGNNINRYNHFDNSNGYIALLKCFMFRRFAFIVLRLLLINMYDYYKLY
jgi:hypothetical protein